MEQRTSVSVARAAAWIRWFGLGRLIAAAVSVLVVLAGGWWLVQPPPEAVEAGLPRASTRPSTVNAGQPSGATLPVAVPVSAVPVQIVVHVAGAVSLPGVYRLASGERVVDAVTAAGGAGPDADVDALNLAARLVDGQRVYVPRHGEVVAVGDLAAAASMPMEPIDLNQATAAELDALPGVGPSTAAAIIAYRSAHGRFTSVAELAEVRGIGPAKLEALRPLVRT